MIIPITHVAELVFCGKAVAENKFDAILRRMLLTNSW